MAPNTHVAGQPPFFGRGGSAFGPASHLQLDHTTDLQSVELNLRRTCADWLSVSAGFRYVELNEELRLDRFLSDTGIFDLRIGGPRHTRFRFETQNDLYGFQLGGDAVLLRRCGLSIDGFLKSGLYANSARSNASSDGFIIIREADSKSDQVSSLGEAGLYASHAFNRIWSVRAGYQVLWLTGIAMAADQLRHTANGFGNTRVEAEGTDFYHGFHGRLEARW